MYECNCLKSYKLYSRIQEPTGILGTALSEKTHSLKITDENVDIWGKYLEEQLNNPTK